ALELRAFAHDRIARRSFLRFLASPNASLIVADGDDAIRGYALVLFRARSQLARLYSIAVDADYAGRRIGSRLLSAAEDVADRHASKAMRLEVREGNTLARKLYGMFGYSLIERLAAYYEMAATRCASRSGSARWRSHAIGRHRWEAPAV